MTSAKIFKNIESDSYYLLRQYLYECFFWLLVGLSIYFLRDYSPFEMSWNDIIYLIPAVCWGWFLSSLIHNTSHQNIKNQFLNRLCGEIAGLWLMYGFKNFVFIHFLHHKFSDKEFDPVNPEGMTFFVFLTAPMRYMIERSKLFLFFKFSNEENYHKIYRWQYILFQIGLVIRVGVIASLLGPKYFIVFYIPSLIGNIGILAHINFACHRDIGEDTVEIVNLNHSLYYKIANFITSGGYFHKNHHLNPNLYNPSKLTSRRSNLPLISRGLIINTSAPTVSYGGGIVQKYFDIHSIWGNGEKNKIIKDDNYLLKPTRNLYWKTSIGF